MSDKRTLRYTGDTLTIRTNGEETVYDVKPALGGSLFLLKRTPGIIFPIPYLISPRLTCTCPGFVHRKKCRHVDAIRKLREIGKMS